MNLAATLRGTTYRFKDVKDVLARANEEKSGDRLAGVAAGSVSERVAAKRVLAELTLQELYENPVVPAERDAVTRLILDDLQRPVFDGVKSWTVAQLREHVLADRTTGAELLRLSRGLTSEMIAACAKLMTNLDLISAARKIRVVVHAANTLGLEGRLSTRLQPNHPSDSIEGILASLRDGLSFGSGDAVIGINPVTDNPEQTTAILNASGDFMRQWRIPTQNCCLAHVTTQMKALEKGAQLGL
ncbi:MAG TPA: ethanolamine ammonia-lyase subunit EutB, partial [Polyangia bacterium]|nr:ethanolamine ammonia-lyase subunit EutB [Polyangia bacterium]